MRPMLARGGLSNWNRVSERVVLVENIDILNPKTSKSQIRTKATTSFITAGASESTSR